MKTIKKRRGCGLKLTTRTGKNGNYLFIKTPNGSYHAFLEIAAKEAARECNAIGAGNSRQLCKQICRF